MNKSKDFGVLTEHLRWIFLGVLPLFLFFGEGLHPSLWASILYTILHGVQDWYLWRFYGWIRDLGDKAKITEFRFWEDSLWYDFIAANQFLHLGIGFILLRVVS